MSYYDRLPDGLYCIYLRKSREDAEAERHGEGDTLLRHETMLMNLAKRYNITIGAVYKEIVSGESIDARPEVQKVIHEVEQGKWAGVLVVEVERLARGDTLDQGIIARAFSISGALIVTPMRVYNPAEPADMEYFEFGLFMSRREYATINRRIQAGRVASVKEGKWIYSCAPYGYERVKLENDKGWTLAFHPEESEVVRLIWQFYLYERLGSYQIAEKLAARGIKNRSGNPFSPYTIRDIIDNIVYAGYIKKGDRPEVKVIVDGRIVKRRIKNPNPLIVKGIHPAFITLEEYELGQQIKKNNTIPSVNSRHGLQNTLAGICKCGLCGRTMLRQDVSRRGRHDIRFLCNNVHCDNMSSKFDLVEDAVLDALDAWTRYFELSPVPLQVKEDTFEADIARLEKEKTALQGQTEKLYDLLERGVYDEALFLKRSRELAMRIADADTAIKRIAAEQKEKQQVVTLEEFMERVKTVRDIYSRTERVEDKNLLLKSVFKEIRYTKTTGGVGHESDFVLEIQPIVDFL